MKVTKTVSVDEEVWEMLESIANKKFTNKSEMVQRLIINEYEKLKEE